MPWELSLQGLREIWSWPCVWRKVWLGTFFLFPSQNLGQPFFVVVVVVFAKKKVFFSVHIQVQLPVLFLLSEMWDVRMAGTQPGFFAAGSVGPDLSPAELQDGATYILYYQFKFFWFYIHITKIIFS